MIHSFQGSSFVQFCILNILYMYIEPLEAILSVNFGLFGENLVTSFI